MSDKKAQAYQDYLDGMKYADIAKKYEVDIAKKYEVSESAVKQWARREWKNKDVTLNGKVTNEKVTKVTQSPRTRGGANNIKHGAYRGVYDHILNDKERDIMANGKIPNAEQELVAKLNILIVREIRLFEQKCRNAFRSLSFFA